MSTNGRTASDDGVVVVDVLAEKLSKVVLIQDDHVIHLSRPCTHKRWLAHVQFRRGLRQVAELPVAVGFGISTPEQAAWVGNVADGVIVGSALIHALDEGGPEGAGAYLTTLRSAMDEGASSPP